MSQNSKILSDENTFHFTCHPGLDCFTHCCQEVNILLTPYDILQMKNGLGISSTEFLKTYTKTLIAPETLLPAVQFKMDEEKEKRCYFVAEEGCEIYQHRPWSCRMYPLDISAEGKSFEPMVDSSRCLGLNNERSWLLQEWFDSQGLGPYTTWNQRFAEITEDRKISSWRKQYPGGFEIFFLACYDLDRFREQVFKENLYEMLDQPPSDLSKLKADDLALLKFAFAWLKTVAEGKAER